MTVPPYVIGATDAAILGNLDAGKAEARMAPKAKAAEDIARRVGKADTDRPSRGARS